MTSGSISQGAEVRQLDLRRRIGRVAARRAGVGPGGHEVDLGLRQGAILLELLDADVRIDVPGRHLAGDDLVPDGARPGPRLLVVHQRHRRHVVGPMADLTRALQDGLDVLVEGHVARLRGGNAREQHHNRGRRRDQRQCGFLHLNTSRRGTGCTANRNGRRNQAVILAPSPVSNQPDQRSARYRQTRWAIARTPTGSAASSARNVGEWWPPEVVPGFWVPRK